MTIDERKRLRELCEKATPGPWRAQSRKDQTAQVYCPQIPPMRQVIPVAETSTTDAAFIAAARTAVPALLDALDAAEAERDRLRAKLETIAGGEPPPAEYAAHPIAVVLSAVIDFARAALEVK